jgi:TatD DNase family protein
MSASESQPGLRLVDSHAHLDMPVYNDREEVLVRAQSAGVAAIVSVGIDLASSREAALMAANHSLIYAAVGIHPQEARNVTAKDIAGLSVLTLEKRVVAIGEIGLDFYRVYAPADQQIRVLEWQLAFADNLGLPVIIHSRQAEKEMISVLTAWRPRRIHPEKPAGVIHCFNGTLETARTYLDLGFYISLGAYTGYPSSKAFREVIKQIPLDKLLVETDSPFLPPQRIRGERNEPAFVVEAARVLAEIKGASLDEVARITTSNASLLFGLGFEGY